MGANSASYKLRVKSDATVDNGIYLSAGTGSSNHAFYVEDRDGTAEYFAVRGDGEIRLNASSGHTYAAKGIRLGANASSNNLDDYEEGTFTALLANDGVGNTQLSRYTKVGRLVFYQIYMSSKNITNAGNCRVSGLPFVSDNTQGYGIASYWHGTAITANLPVTGYTTGTHIDIVRAGSTAYAQWATGTNKAIMLAGFYTTA